MRFKNVIGQEIIKGQLVKSVRENRVSHAQLFLGPEGCGNLAMALAYAQYINCENKTETDSCGECPSCIKSEKFIHPDIHFTFPFINAEKKEKCADWMPEWREFLSKNVYADYNDWIQQISTENKQGNINAKECMDILHRLSFTTFESEYKIVILWLPEFLEKEGNRLLKILEEPPGNTVFLFVAGNADRILNTIFSRLQLVKFKRLSGKEIAGALMDKDKLTQEQAMQIAALCDGNFNEAIRMLGMRENENAELFITWMAFCYNRAVKDLFAANDKLAKTGRENLKNFFQYILHFLREVILLQNNIPDRDKLTDREKKLATLMAKQFSMQTLQTCSELVDKSIYFTERNANAKILLTYISLQFLKAFHQTSEATVKKIFYTGWEL